MALTSTSGPQQQVAMPAVDLRQLLGSVVATEGVRVATDLGVGQRGAGANMSVDVAAGSALIQDDHGSGGGFYAYTSAATLNVAVSVADATNPRIDRVVLRVRDQALGDAANDMAPIVVAGTPTGGATLANLTGAAAVPGSSLLLANVLVPAASSSVTSANIDATVKATLAPAGATLTKLVDTTLGVTAGQVDITSISGSYAHLMIEVLTRTDRGATSDTLMCRFNGDGGANYDYQFGNFNSTVAATTETFAAAYLSAGECAASTGPGSYFSSHVIFVPNYTSGFHKNVISLAFNVRAASAGGMTLSVVGARWRSTAAINRVTFLPIVGPNLINSTRVTIYGMGA